MLTAPNLHIKCPTSSTNLPSLIVREGRIVEAEAQKHDVYSLQVLGAGHVAIEPEQNRGRDALDLALQ